MTQHLSSLVDELARRFPMVAIASEINKQMPGLIDFMASKAPVESASPSANLALDGAAEAALNTRAQASAPEGDAAFERECADIDTILAKLGLTVEQARTEGGALRVARICNHIQETIDALAQAHSFGVAMSDNYTRSNAKAGEVESLPSKWRRWAENMRGKVAANRIRDCADELEAALSTQRGDASEMGNGNG